MTFFIGESLRGNEDYVAGKIASFIKESSIHHGFVFLYDEETETENEPLKVEFSWFLDEENKPTLIAAETLESLNKSGLVEVETGVDINEDPSVVPSIKISESLSSEIERVAIDNSWKRRAWCEITTFKNAQFTEIPYTILVHYLYKEDPEKEEMKEGELFIQTTLDKNENGMFVKGIKDEADVNFINLF